MVLNKIKTGVSGLDHMLGGGLIEGRPYLIAGGPGAGKTILCMHFLMEGAANGERGLFIALEEPSIEIMEDMAVFGWDTHRIKILDTTQELGTWTFKTESVISKPEFTLANLLNVLNEKLTTYKPKRIVIDSLTSVKMLSESSLQSRRDLLNLMNFLYNSGCTSLLTAESYGGEDTLMEEFLTSGVIRLHNIESQGDKISAVMIEKMRGSSFDKHLRPMKITDKGIIVFPDEPVLR